MGYNLYIGEAEVEAHLEDRYARVGVKAMELPEAPVNSTDDRLNRIWPSYSAWANFCRRHGLMPVFYGKSRGYESEFPEWFRGASGKQYDALLGRHPGAEKLTEDHYLAFKAARDRLPPPADGEGEELQYDRKRLDWLVWWTRWALDNCRHPTLANS